MIQVSEKSFHSISMDVTGRFPPSQGYEYALDMVNWFLLFLRIVPLKKKYNTHDIITAFISKIYYYNGMPQEIISNQGPQFILNYFIELY